MYVLGISWLVAALGIILGYFAVKNPTNFVTKHIPDLYLFGKIRKLDEYGLTQSMFQVPKRGSSGLQKTCNQTVQSQTRPISPHPTAVFRGTFWAGLAYCLLTIPLIQQRWFFHFYLTGIIVNTTVFGLTLYTVFSSGKWPSFFQNGLSILGHDTGTVEPWPVLLALLMEEVHVIRRFLECVFVNTYSDSHMSIVIYLVGLLFYCNVGISCVSPMSTRQVYLGSLLRITTWYQVLAVAVFLWASWKQYRINRIMAKLRHDKNGNISNTEHHIPHGDLFEYCSCPHYFTEILIYAAIASLFLWQHQICVCMFTFVFTNQMIAGYLTHYWYRQKFDKYPASRTAIIPFLF